jgi:hypothetical protein
MTLDQYLSLPGSPTNAEFGERCDPKLSGVSIWRIRRGEQNISRDTIRSIILATGGNVTAEELLIRNNGQEAA